MTVHTAAEAPSRPGVAASVVDATKAYGTGATEVRGLDHVTLDFASGGRKSEMLLKAISRRSLVGLGCACQSAGMRWVRVLVVAGPAVMLAGLGLTHPQELTAASASWWTTLHVILLPIFPLLAVSLWLLLRGVPGPVAWVARIAAYGYATFYSVTDVLVGIGAGELTQFNAARRVQERTVEVDRLFTVGNDVGEIGVWCFLVACAATALAIVAWVGRRALPGAVVLVVAGVLFTGGWHIYWPAGVVTMLVLAVGLGLWPWPCPSLNRAATGPGEGWGQLRVPSWCCQPRTAAAGGRPQGRP